MANALYLLIAVAVMSIITFIVYLTDWRRAQIDRVYRRIPEDILMLLTVCLGAPGALAAMEILLHKKRHKIFRVMVPILAAVQILGVVLFYIFGE